MAEKLVDFDTLEAGRGSSRRKVPSNSSFIQRPNWLCEASGWGGHELMEVFRQDERVAFIGYLNVSG
jgi:hypothetical protein